MTRWANRAIAGGASKEKTEMVAVAPALPKQPASPGARAPKSTGTADFGRLLQEAGGSEPAAPEQSPTPPAPEDRAPPRRGGAAQRRGSRAQGSGKRT